MTARPIRPLVGREEGATVGRGKDKNEIVVRSQTVQKQQFPIMFLFFVSRGSSCVETSQGRVSSVGVSPLVERTSCGEITTF